MPDVQVTPEDLKQGEALERALAAPQAVALDVCGAWRVIRKFWDWIIQIVKLIPGVGGTIAKALELLGKALDVFCKAQ